MSVCMTPSKLYAAAKRHRVMCNAEVQTEASFVPSCVSLKYAYDPMASEQYNALSELRRMTERCMIEMGKSVFDVVALKDILIRMENDLPSHFPATDLLIITSKLFRRNAELGRLLGVFFGVTFADDRVDEHFHFGEIRLLQRELRMLRRQLHESETERASLHATLNGFGQMALEHGKAVEQLETQNQALQLQTTALEDQMALLFHQLNSDLENYCTDSFDKVTAEMDAQSGMNATRLTFRQTITNMISQMRQSRGIIAELRAAFPLTSSSGAATSTFGTAQNMATGLGSNKTSGINANSSNSNTDGSGNNSTSGGVVVDVKTRLKLKTLDSNFQQLITQFSDIKDVVLTAVDEHMHALQERKKILYLAIQHIRLHDLQNAKLRQGKAMMNDIRMKARDLLERVQVTFPNNIITSIDRFGRITKQRWQGGLTLAALRQGGRGGSVVSDGAPLPGQSNANAADAELSEAAMMAAQSEFDALTAEERISESLRAHDHARRSSYTTANHVQNNFGNNTFITAPRHDSYVATTNQDSEYDAWSKQPRANPFHMSHTALPSASAAVAQNSSGNKSHGNNADSLESSFPALTASASSSSANRPEKDARRVSIATSKHTSSRAATPLLTVRPTSASSPQQQMLPRASLTQQQLVAGLDSNSNNNNNSSNNDIETDSESFKSIQDLLQLVRTLDEGVARLNETLHLEDEMAAFLKTLTLSVPSTTRQGAGMAGASHLGDARAEDVLGRALMPTGASGAAVSLRRAEAGLASDARKVNHNSHAGSAGGNMADGGAHANDADEDALLHPGRLGSAPSSAERKGRAEDGKDTRGWRVHRCMSAPRSRGTGRVSCLGKRCRYNDSRSSWKRCRVTLP